MEGWHFWEAAYKQQERSTENGAPETSRYLSSGKRKQGWRDKVLYGPAAQPNLKYKQEELLSGRPFFCSPARATVAFSFSERIWRAFSSLLAVRSLEPPKLYGLVPSWQSTKGARLHGPHQWVLEISNHSPELLGNLGTGFTHWGPKITSNTHLCFHGFVSPYEDAVTFWSLSGTAGSVTAGRAAEHFEQSEKTRLSWKRKFLSLSERPK